MEEELKKAARKASTLASLALFDTPDRAGDVGARLQQFGTWARDETFRDCNLGAHERFGGHVHLLARNTEMLAERVMELR